MSRNRPSTPSLSKQLDILFARGLVICGICGEPIRSRDECGWDHIHEHADGGADTVDNMQPVHRVPCHQKKSAKAETQRHHIERLAGSPVQKPALRTLEERQIPRKKSFRPERRDNTKRLEEL